MRNRSQRILTGSSGCIVAVGIGIATVGLAVLGHRLFLGGRMEFADEWSILLFQVFLVAAPFGMLALARESGWIAWLTAIALTALFWGLYIGDAIARQGAGGANIGLGLLMLVSPLIITGGAFAATALARRKD